MAADEKAIGAALIELAPPLAKLLGEVLGDLDPPLTYRQYRALDRVDQGLATVTQLARSARVSAATMSASVETMVQRGLLSRRAAARDRRSSDLELTVAGRKQLRSARKRLEALGADLTAVVVAALDSDDSKSVVRAAEAAVAETRRLRGVRSGKIG